MPEVLRPEQAWRSQAWTFARCSVSSGLAFALVSLLWTGRPARALIQGAIYGAAMGVFITRERWRRWPGAARLTPSQRVAVVAAVSRGAAPEDPALATAALGYVATVRGEDSGRWQGVPALVLTVALLLFAALISSGGGSLLLWGLLALAPVVFLLGRLRRPRVFERLAAAEDASRRLLASQGRG